MRNFCGFATDYTALLRELKDPLKLRASDRIIQYPFSLPVVEEKTEAELADIAERKREQGRRLQMIAAKARLEKVRIECYVNLKRLTVHIARPEGE